MEKVKDFEEKPLTLKEELFRLQKMRQLAKLEQLGITLGLLDIFAEVQCIYKDRGMKVPPEVEEAFKP